MTQHKASEESVKLLADLKQNKVRFAHWKGNSHLLESLEGKTDIEILVQPDERHLFESVMKNLGYKRLQSQAWNSYPQVEDWIGFDNETGNLLHLHTHYALIVAIRYGRYLHLPWTDEFFDHLMIDEQTGWPVPEPELEAVILLIRICAKAEGNAHKKQEVLSAKQQELFTLLRNVKAERLELICNKLQLKVPADISERIQTILQEAGLAEAKNLAEYFYNQLPASQRENTFSSSLKSAYYKYYLKTSRSYSRFAGPVKQKKTISNGGKVIALIGSDGSGKSTLSNDITKWLTFKIDTHYFYMGKMPFIRSYDKQLFSKADIFVTGNKLSKILKKLIGDFYYVLMIKQKSDMLQIARKMSRQGSIIICDRFPQKDIMGINDGPKLQSLTNKWPSRIEMKLFNQITEAGADVVFRLQVPPEVAHKRKPEHSYAVIKQKCDNINKIAYANSPVIDLDASKPYDQVLLDVKREVWKHL